jgi:hypothetical protein
MEGGRKVVWEGEAQAQLHPNEERNSSLEDGHQDFHVFQQLHTRYRPKINHSQFGNNSYACER